MHKPRSFCLVSLTLLFLIRFGVLYQLTKDTVNRQSAHPSKHALRQVLKLTQIFLAGELFLNRVRQEPPEDGLHCQKTRFFLSPHLAVFL